jgi:GNAT superfamily N-acetyltransferase
MNFQDALTMTYIQDPCQVLPNALWKTLAQFKALQTAFQVQDELVTHLEAWDEDRLLVYWSRQRNQEIDLSKYMENPRLALVHQDYAHCIPGGEFEHRWKSFRLLYRPGVSEAAEDPPPGFSFAVVNPRREARQVGDFINQCYPNMHLKSDTVRSWTDHPVYDPNLWIWTLEDATGSPAGLGIAELDREIGEGSLEWVQVHPHYRRKGVGTSLVRALLARLEGVTQFTTVAGRVDNPTHPERLYRRCGFSGGDVWWVFSNGGA